RVAAQPRAGGSIPSFHRRRVVQFHLRPGAARRGRTGRARTPVPRWIGARLPRGEAAGIHVERPRQEEEVQTIARGLVPPRNPLPPGLHLARRQRLAVVQLKYGRAVALEGHAQHQTLNGHFLAGAIGDVTGHGLESGILMVMIQTAIRTLKEVKEISPDRFLDIINRTIYQNVQRMDSMKNLTLSILNYADQQLSITGQHEEVIVMRANGQIERIDTLDLGFPIGLVDQIDEFIGHVCVQLNRGDGVVLYTDGITEASDMDNKLYGLDQLCQVLGQNWHHSVDTVKQAVIDDLRRHVGTQQVFDDITLVVIKQR
ncbi:MAG: PP2C family protein-serine/threonine phosphatase, partial [Acaryochloridaceae cyanobacterium SU_2_1]|nr:PP2C family protein-serine/threonine phosphatase [Acaryochloridaceae cyanobacterium SU_2_1]